MKELLHTSEFEGFPLDLHQVMLQDASRMQHFAAALQEAVQPGDTVVDVGCGTGILALLAWRAGAGRAIAIERSEIIEPARRWIAERYPQAPIEFLRLDLEREQLPDLQADVLVCELLGNLGPEERMLPVLERACSRMLKDTGLVVPAQVQLVAAPVNAPDVFEKLSRWSQPIMGFDLSVFDALAKARVYHLQGESILPLAPAVSYRTLDFKPTSVTQTAHRADFECQQTGDMHGFACWFEAQLSASHCLRTGPADAVTHWGQVFFPLAQPTHLAQGDRVHFELELDGNDFDVTWTWSGTIQHLSGEPSSFRCQAQGST